MVDDKQTVTLSASWFFDDIEIVEIPVLPEFYIDAVLSPHNRIPADDYRFGVYSGVRIKETGGQPAFRQQPARAGTPDLHGKFKDHFFGKVEHGVPATRIKLWHWTSDKQKVRGGSQPAGLLLEIVGPHPDLTLSQIWYLLRTRPDLSLLTAFVRDKDDDRRLVVVGGCFETGFRPWINISPTPRTIAAPCE